ncbi:hypothetical protein [Eisenbergiella tayi]|uniref:hypothetical protein n=1 Tax=Eisenbergiella tayi TaxID=1432052 RepID=UPI0014041B40|nr:hypothetical protein [Eisenbergiella tayi]MBS6813047.1 hypothetical protein [Lachnospiraceae bacterium]MDT4531412.1 hypothetical protein [Eisenbergiella tayi]
MKTAGRPWQCVLPEPFAIHLTDVYIRWRYVSDGCMYPTDARRAQFILRAAAYYGKSRERSPQMR